MPSQTCQLFLGHPVELTINVIPYSMSSLSQFHNTTPQTEVFEKSYMRTRQSENGSIDEKQMAHKFELVCMEDLS